MSEEPAAKFVAFLSYSRADRAVAERLHSALEAYRVPKELGGQRLRPIFRDRDDLQSGGVLSDHLRDALADSRYLIVLCSKAAAQSSWVNQEAQTFIDLGRTGAIIPVIAELDFDGDIELIFPPALRGRGLLAADLRSRTHKVVQGGGDGWRDGLLKVVAGLLNKPLDVVRRRHAMAQRRAFGLRAAGALGIILLVALIALPIAEWRRRSTLVEVARSTSDTTLSSHYAIAAMPPSGAVFSATPDDALELATPMLLRLTQSVLPRTYSVMLPINESDPTILLADERTLRRWRLRDGAMVVSDLKVRCNENPSTPWNDCLASALAVDDDGRVAVGMADGQIVILEGGERRFMRAPAPISALQYNAAGDVLIAAAHDGKLYAFEIASGRVRATRDVGFVVFGLLAAEHRDSGERRLIAANSPEYAFTDALVVSERPSLDEYRILNHSDLSDTRLWAPGLANARSLPPLPRVAEDEDRLSRPETALLFRSADGQFVVGSAQTDYSVARQLFVAASPDFDVWYRAGVADTRLQTYMISEFVLFSTDTALVATDMNRVVALGRLMREEPRNVRAAACADGSLNRISGEAWRGLHLWESDYRSVGASRRAALGERLPALDLELCRRQGLLRPAGWTQIPEALSSLALRP